MFGLNICHRFVTPVRATTLEEMIKKSPEKVGDIDFDYLYDFDEYSFSDLDDDNILIEEMKNNWFYSNYEDESFIACLHFIADSNQYVANSLIPFYIANDEILKIELTYSDSFCNFSNTLADQIYDAADDISSGRYGGDEKTKMKLYHKLFQEALVLFDGYSFLIEDEKSISQKIQAIIEYAAERVLFPNSTF